MANQRATAVPKTAATAAPEKDGPPVLCPTMFKFGQRVVIQKADIPEEAHLPVVTPKCSKCSSSDASRLCYRCKQVCYCTQEHQVNDFARHRGLCMDKILVVDSYIGMHGTVINYHERPPYVKQGARFPADGRFLIDLDLIPPKQDSRIALPGIFLKVEGAPVRANLEVAQIKKGVLVPSEGKPLNLLLDFMRLVVAKNFFNDPKIQQIHHVAQLRQQPNGIAALARLTNAAWAWYSDDAPGLPDTSLNKGRGVYFHLKQLILKEIPAANIPEHTKSEFFQRAMRAIPDARGALGWGCRVSGNFWVVGMDNDGTYLIPNTNRKVVYRCVSTKDAIWPMILAKQPRRTHGSKPTPLLMRMTLIPWFGRLVSDGIVLPPDGKTVPPAAPPQLMAELEATVELVKRQKRVISKLAQLEVEDGSQFGVHGKNFFRPNPVGAKLAHLPEDESQPPISDEEREYLVKLNLIPKTMYDIAQPDMLPHKSTWAFQRVTEYDGVIMCLGTKLADFRYIMEIATAVDILKALEENSRVLGRRPVIIGINEPECVKRVHYLLKAIDGTMVTHHAPLTDEDKEELERQSFLEAGA